MINIYKASAGSGKTYTLAREYIKLILGHKNENGLYELNPHGGRSGHRGVLAMTFTNKATEEMKSRIIHELAVLAGCERGWSGRSPYEKDLCATFRCSLDRLSDAAMDALRNLLYDFNRFSISTIDSFFQAVLRAFAHEADVSSNYALELDDEAVITMSVEQLLQSLNHGEPSRDSHEIEAWITGYMKSLINEGNQFTLFNRSGNVQAGLIKFIADIHNDTFKDNEKLIMDYLSDSRKFHSFRDTVFHKDLQIKEETARICEEALTLIEDHPDSSGVKKNILDSIRGWKKRNTVSDTVRRTIGCPSNMWKKNVHISEDVETAVVSSLIAIDKYCDQAATIKLIRENLYQIGLLGSLMRLIDRFRRENSTLLLSDTNTLLAKIIGSDDAPFLYERLGVRYRNYLIDEFQDTSLSQWANIRPLLRESLAYDHDNLVIGDEKQCIYRFRDSDPSLLHNLDREPWTHGRTKVSGNAVSENTNWRSSADVVNFNNALFTSIARQYCIEDVYSNVVQQVSPKHSCHHGYVRLKCFNDSNDEQGGEPALAQLAAEMRRQLSSGYNPGDIAILVRKKNEGEKVIAYLEDVRRKDPDFPAFDIISDQSLLISNSDAVMSIVSRLRMLSSIESVSDSHYYKSPHEVARILNDYDSVFAAGAEPAEALSVALKKMAARADNGGMESADPDELDSLHGVDLLSLVESIIDSYLPQELREKDSVYITAFVDLLVDYMSHGRADIRSFLQWWDDKGCKNSIAGGSDSRALNILTVHKSKGLEFPCVHIPFAEFSSAKKRDISWFELPHIDGIPDDILPPMMPLGVSKAMLLTPFAEQYEEIVRERTLDQTNLLYVAFTRAVDELIIGVKLKKSDMKEGELVRDTEPSVSRMIYDGVNGARQQGLMPLAFDNDLSLTIGTPTHKRTEDVTKATAMRPSESVRLPAYQSTDSASVWRNTNIDIRRLNRIEVARERGLILHELMSHIRKVGDIGVAFELLRATPDARRLTNADIVALREIIDARVHDSRAVEWFENFDKVYIERELLTSEGKLRRADRVVWTAGGEIHVVDYKTGSQDPAKYKKQIIEYIRFFRSMYCHNVRGFLYYLDTGEIIEVQSD